MANVTEYDPFGDIDDFFKGFMLRPVRFDSQLPRIRIDVTEADGAYVVRADIPGVKKEDIKVDVDGNLVSISAETRVEKEKKEGERVIHSERSYGRVARSFTLEQDVDEKAASAGYADGVLELKLPKKAGAAQKTIAVQ
ncbi:MAG TPA: Hsp20/alpha crystallin family protein [Burkholderiales bacterium]|nr:Hsp20/alpha crystallin family protein [Burkholderiales bacterium]